MRQGALSLAVCGPPSVYIDTIPWGRPGEESNTSRLLVLLL